MVMLLSQCSSLALFTSMSWTYSICSWICLTLGCFDTNAGHHFFTDTQSAGAEQPDFIRVELPKTQQNRSDQFWSLLKNMVGLLPAWNYLLQNNVTLGSSTSKSSATPHPVQWWLLVPSKDHWKTGRLVKAVDSHHRSLSIDYLLNK